MLKGFLQIFCRFRQTQKLVSQKYIKNIKLQLVEIEVLDLTYMPDQQRLDLPSYTKYEIRYTYKGSVTSKQQIQNLLREEVSQYQKSTQNLRDKVQTLRNTSKKQIIQQLQQQLQNLEEQKKNELENYQDRKKWFNDQMKQINNSKKQIKDQIVYMGNIKKRQKDIKDFKKSLEERNEEIQRVEKRLQQQQEESEQTKNELQWLVKNYTELQNEYNYMIEYKKQEISSLNREINDKKQSIRNYDYQNKRVESLLRDPIKLNIQKIKENVKKNKQVMHYLQKLGELYKMPQRTKTSNSFTATGYKTSK